jgi:hypothetical protein
MCEIEMHDEWGLVPGDALWLSFEYTPRPVVLFAEPSSGPVDGGTTVVVVGEGLGGSSEARCGFGSLAGNATIVVATVESTTKLRCRAPAHRAGDVRLEVTVDGLEYSADGRGFLYHESMLVLSIAPSSGEAGHEHSVTVIGAHFQRTGVWCAVNSSMGAVARTVGVWRSSSAAECTLPALSEGNASVEVSSNGVERSSSGVRFVYSDGLPPLGVEPSAGPMLGGTAVTVRMARAARHSEGIEISSGTYAAAIRAYAMGNEFGRKATS